MTELFSQAMLHTLNFLFHQSLAVFAGETKSEKKKLCCCVLKCHGGNNVPTHRLFIVQCFWEVGFSSALLVCLH